MRRAMIAVISTVVLLIGPFTVAVQAAEFCPIVVDGWRVCLP